MMLTIRAIDSSHEHPAEAIFEVLSSVYEYSPWSLEYLKKDLALPYSHYYVALDSDKIIGFLAITKLINEIEITNLAVCKAYQRQNIAHRLFALILEQSEEEMLNDSETTLFLEVRASNVIAQKLYQNLGFEAYHTRKNYYQDPVEDAILMRKLI